MLFQPTNVIPSDSSGFGSGTIDATQDLYVTWQVNGQSPMLAYQLDFYQNDANSMLLYSTGRIALAVPFYGTDNKGAVQFFVSNAIDDAALNLAGIVNGSAIGYKYIITQWWSETDKAEQTAANAFIARATPTLSLEAFDNPLASKQHEFVAEYAQADGDALSWIQWQVAQGYDERDIIFDSGNIYGTMDLRMAYDGFFSGESYSVRCMAQTINGIGADTGWRNFDVAYTTKTYPGFLTATQARSHCGVFLEFSGATSISGTGSGDYFVENGFLTLRPGSSALWDSVNDQSMTINPPYALVWKGELPASGGTGWSVSFGSMDLSLIVDATGTVSLVQDNITLYSADFSGSAAGWWTTILNQNRIYIQHIADGTTTNYSGVAQPASAAILSIELTGEQVCDYIWIENAALSDETISAILSNASYAPAWSANTGMLALFETGLDAGNLDFSGYAIYREELGTNTMIHLVDVPLNVSSLIDFGAKSQTTYVYRVYSIGGGEFLSNPLISNEITPLYWNYSIVECETGENGEESVVAEYAFANNVETGEMTNSNSPQLLDNFTPYPIRQPHSSNYKTGTLGAYLGKVDQLANTYTDTDKQADELCALSVTKNTLYLKTRKGAIRKIATNAPIKMKVGDQYAEQPYTISVSWAEIGAANNASITALQGSPLWPSDNVMNTSAYVDPKTGQLYWITPAPYTDGSVIALDTIGNLVQSYTSMFTPAEMAIDHNGNLNATTKN